MLTSSNMGSIQDDFAISLRSWPLKAPDPMSALPELIGRIDEQRGGFRKINVESLTQEIAGEEAAAAAAGEDAISDDEEKEEEEPDRMKALQDARTVMLHNIFDAHAHAAQALDFISLLLTKDLPTQASATINPALRDAVPMGSLGMDKLVASRHTEQQRLDNTRVAKAWKVQSLDKSVDSILESATRLEKEIEKETKYWEEILSISDAGWALCKLPYEKHTLGVRFGFSESAPVFKSRSLAALRRNSDGSIFLDQGLANAEPKAVRVRIRDSSSRYIGSSTVPLPLSDEAPIDSTILQARNVIFDAELWQEINRESRSLASYGVRADDDTVTCVLTSQKTVVIDLVPLGESTESAQMDNKVAEGINLALHILLSVVHRQKYRRRTQAPPPISNSKQSNPTYNLLRPLLARLNHQFALTSIQSLFQPLCSVFNVAEMSPKPSYEIVSIPPNADMLRGPSATETAVTSLTDRLESISTFTITDQTKIILKSTTAMYPICSTSHSVSLSPESPLNITCKPPPHADSWDKTEEYLLYATAGAIASSFVQPASLDGQPSIWETTIAADTLHKRNDNVLGGQSTQLMFHIGVQKGAVKLRVKWENGTPTSRQAKPASGKSKQTGNGAYEWKSTDATPRNKDWDDGEGMVIRSLQSVVDEVGRTHKLGVPISITSPGI